MAFEDTELPQAEWRYERGEGRTKHCWANDHAGFQPSGRGAVGKCHASITDEVAEQLLREGVVYHAPGTTSPEHVYNVYRGVIYEAAPTQPGKSFHGYPWCGAQGRPPLPPRIIRQLRCRAEQQGYENEFEKWLKTYS